MLCTVKAVRWLIFGKDVSTVVVKSSVRFKDLVREAELVTAANDRRTLNVAFSYTSREEISQVRGEKAELWPFETRSIAYLLPYCPIRLCG